MRESRTEVTTAKDVSREMEQLGDPEIATFSQRFFKTGPGQYGEGDVFRGIRVPVLRRVAKDHKLLALPETLKLLHSPYHEDRIVALLILIHHYTGGNDVVRARIYNSYLKHTHLINNWDLVDCSAPQIVGAHLSDKDRAPLYKLAKSSSLWERRIAIIATFHFIKHGELADTLKLASILLSDREDLIHKAAGWMLREAGKRDLESVESFLREHNQRMPRTMLRYAIERFPERKRLRYLQGRV
jgi:3-methyladenine DNA glycosylase AlkD